MALFHHNILRPDIFPTVQQVDDLLGFGDNIVWPRCRATHPNHHSAFLGSNPPPDDLGRIGKIPNEKVLFIECDFPLGSHDPLYPCIGILSPG